MAQNDYSLLASLAPKAQQPEQERPAESGYASQARTHWRALLGQESGGKQFRPDGSVMTSSKGARGIAQIMESTAPEAARLAGLPYDRTRLLTDPDYNEALGFAYFTEKMREFGGDAPKALAAYNAGSGRVRGAIKRAQEAGNPDAWLEFMPEETRKYVPSILSRSSPRRQPDSADKFTSVKPLTTDRSMSEAVKDNLIGLGAGAVSGVEMISNAFGADNAASETLRGARDGLMENQSDYRKDQRRERAARIQAAENSGSTWAEIKENAAGFLEAPVETSLNAVGTSAPTILAGLIPGVNKTVAARLILQGALGATQGAGSVKGTIYETVERKLIEAGHSPDDAAKVAAGAQAYDSKNAGNIAVGAILGVAAGTGGIESSIAKRSAATAGKNAAGDIAADSLLKRTAKGIVSEMVPEMGQGGQERYAGNVALNNEGFDVDPMQGVAGQAVAEGLAPAPGGGIAGAMSSPAGAAPAPNPAVDAARQQAVKGNSPLSSAAVAGNDAAPAPQPEQANADPMADRLGALEAEIRQGGLLNSVRSSDSPIDSKQFVNDLSIARSPSTSPHLREQALARIEFAVEWARENAPTAPAGTDTGAAVQAIDAALSDTGIQMSERDRATLADLRSMIAVGNMGAQAKAALAQQAMSLIGPYRAGAMEAVANDAPAALLGEQQAQQDPSQRPGGALLNGLGRNAIQPTVGTTEQGQAASQEAEARLQQLAEEDGQAGVANGSIKAVPAVAPEAAANSATEAANARLGQLEQEESVNQFEADTKPVAQAAPEPEPEQAPADPAFDRITEPRVAIPADDGSGVPAARRKRRAVLDNLAGLGFDRVERRDDGFYFLNPRTRQEFKLDGMADAQMANVAARRALDAAAQKAATSNQNDTPQPSEAQAKAGKYAKGNLKFDGLDIAIENPVGSTRSGTDPDGNKWSVDMSAHYGFVRRTMGADGDQVDVYIAQNAKAGAPVFVIDQHNDDGSFDEHKVILGARTQAEAERIYDAHFSDGSGPARRRGIKTMTMDEFKSWLKSDGTKAPAAVEDIAATVEPGYAPGAVIYSDGERTAVAADESKFPEKAVPPAKTKARYRVSKGQAVLLRSIAAVFGKKVAFFTGIRDDGFVLNSKPDTIFINQETGISTLAVLGHELLHLLKTDMPQAYAAIAKVIRSRVANAKAFREDYYGKFIVVDGRGMAVGAFHRQADANKALAALGGKGSIKEQAGVELNDNELEELTADLSGNMMRDGKFWSEVFRQIQADSNAPASLISRFVGLITNVIARISSAFSGEKLYEANKFVNDLKEIRKALSQGMSLYAKSAEISANKLKADAMKAATKVRMSTGRTASESPAVGIHFSKQARESLDGAKYGTGMRGVEAQRLSGATDPRIKERVYAYIDNGSGVRPEDNVGGIAHEVKLPKLYDARADVDGLWNASDLNGSESRVLDAGYDGYFVNDKAATQGVAVVLGKASRNLAAKPLNSNVSAEPLKKGLMSQEIEAIDITRIPGAKIRSGTIVVPPQSVQAANDEFERANIAVRFSRERLSTPSEQYAEVEAKFKGTDQWMKAPNGQPTKLSERQWVHVRTDAFKSWFGDWEKFAGMQGGVWNDADGAVSKAVGENGEPLVVYHGTDTAGFMSFKRPGGSGRGDLGIFTTPEWEGAASYVTRGRARNIDAPAMPKTTSDLEDIGYEFYDIDGEFSYSDANGYTYGPFDTEAEALQNALDEYDDSNNIDTRPGVYALFINVREPAESDFEGANWDGQRVDQWSVEVGGEVQYDGDGKAYFQSQDEAIDFAETFVEPEIEDADERREAAADYVVAAQEHYETTDDVVREARRDGRDGAVIRNVMDIGSGPIAPFDPFDVFVAVDPNQLKSADFNDGSYSLNKDDIRLSRDREIDLTSVREIDFSELEGSKVFGIKADLTAAGRTYSGIDGSKIASPIYLMGGPNYPRLPSSSSNNLIWAVRGGATLSKIIKAAKSADYMLVHAMNEFSHLTNFTVSSAYIDTLEAYIRDGRVSRENLIRLDKLVEKYEGQRRINPDEETEDGNKKTKPSLEGFPGFESRSIYKFLDNLSFDQRGALAKILTKKEAQGHGIPNMERFRRDMLDAEYAGARQGDAILVMQIDKSNPTVELGTNGTMLHPSYPLGLQGKLVGKLSKPINYELIYDDYFQNKVPLLKNGPAGAWYTFDRVMPVQEVTPEIARRVSPGSYQGIVSSRQAQAALHFANGDWRTSDANKRDGGISMQEFADALAANDGAAALTLYKASGLSSRNVKPLRRMAVDGVLRVPDAIKWLNSHISADRLEASGIIEWLRGPTGRRRSVQLSEFDARMAELDDTNAGELVRSGKMRIFQLGSKTVEDGGIRIFFGLKKGSPWYSSFIDGITENEVELVSVTNNEKGAPGIAVPAILTKAIEEGATVLDAFAVKSKRFPDGFLPEMYGRFGFEVVGRIPFDPSYYDANGLADLEDFWSKSGWKKSDGYPDVVVMKWKGRDEDRSGTVERYVRTGETGVPSGAARFNGSTTEDAHGQRYQSRAQQGWYGGADRGQARGDQGAGNAAPVVSRAYRGIQEIAGLTDAEARNLGLSVDDVERLSSRLGSTRFSRDRGERDQGRELAPLEGAPTVAGATGPDPRLVEVAERYAQQNGISLKRQAEYVQVDPERASRIADAYAAMPHAPGDRKVKEAYGNLIRQTVAQYRALEDAGYKFYLFDESNDPYQGNPWNAMRDLRANQVMGVFATEAGFGSGATGLDVADNPLLADTGIKWPYGSLDGKRKRVLANDLFRAVHDAFGHGLEGSGFRAQGEENAWQAHVRLFTGSAVAAITSETRGQNSFLNYTAIPLWEIVGEHRARLLYDEGYEGRKEGSESGSLSRGNVSDGEGLPGLQQVERNDVPLLQREESELSALRRQGDNGGTGASDSSGVSGRGWPSANAGAPAGSDRQQRQLRARESSLGNPYGESQKPAPLKNSDAQRQDSGDVGLGGGDWRIGSGSLDQTRQVQVDRRGGTGDTHRQGRAPLWKTITVGEHNRRAKVEDTIFADQKTGLMPEWTWTEGRVSDMAQQVKRSAERAPAFYSQLQRAIEQVPARLSTMAAPQWAQWLKANASKLGVKQDEVTWSGIEDYLKLRGKDKIDSAELAAWVGANGVRVDETSLGDGGREYTYAEWAEANHPDTYKKLIEARESGDAESYHYLNRVLSRDWRAGLGRKRVSGSTKYGDYTVPGGAKYRELLLTLPERATSMQAVTDWQKRMLAKYGYDMSRGMTDAEKAEGVALREAAEAKSAIPYKSSHWDQPNILAHVRVDERTDADGKRVLFVNELQSDWGQDGRKKGFSQAEAARISGVAERDDYGDWRVVWADGTFSGGYSEEGARAKAAEGKANAKAGVPAAPFVTKTEGWLNLALKRIAMLAVEGGYDKVAFISGKQAADLYQLSNQIDRIDYNLNDDGTYNLSAIKDGREVFAREDVPDLELEDIVGKEVAQKIVNGEGRRPEEFDEVDRWDSEDDDGGDFDFNATPKKTLSGLDLEVGGDGMKGFYDQIVPQAISKLLPRLGGEKLTKVGIPDGNAGREVVASQVPGEHMWGVYDRQMGQWLSSWDAETYASDPEDAEMMGEATAKSIASAIMRDAGVMLDQTGFEVTEKMRDTVLSGVPLFSRERAADAESDVDQTQDKYNQRIEALRELVACLTK